MASPATLNLAHITDSISGARRTTPWEGCLEIYGMPTDLHTRPGSRVVLVNSAILRENLFAIAITS